MTAAINVTPDNIKEQLASLSPAQKKAVREQALIMLARGEGVEAVRAYALFTHSWVLEPHHIEWLGWMFSGERVLIVAPPEALALDTPILTSSGWKTMGTLDVGETVFDERGAPTKIVETSQTYVGRPLYDVVFSDGSTIRTDEEHRWVTWCWDASKRERIEKKAVTTRQIRDSIYTCRANKQTRHAIPVAGAVQLAEQELPLDPYLLGLWMGDGDTSGYEYTTGDEEVLTHFINGGFRIRKDKRSFRYYIYGITPLLRKAGVLNNKHIPENYLLGSIAQRQALLQGLMDSDGRIGEDGNCRFSNTNKSLSGGVLALANSLGCKAVMTSKLEKRTGKIDYFVHFTPTLPVFRISRKLARQRNDYRTVCRYRYIREVRSVQTEPVRCISVDSPSRLYLAGRSLIPTHNTGKTRLIKVFMEWYIGKYPEKSALYIQNASDQAKAQVTSVGKVLKESEQYRKIFPHIIPTETWGGAKLLVRRDPSSPMFSRAEANLEGYGLFGAYQGKHVETEVLDDPTNQKDVQSPSTMLSQKEQVKGVLRDRLKDGGNFFGILTRWAADDLVPTLEQLGVTILVYPARKGTANSPKSDTYPWGHLLQESMYPDEKLDQLKREKGPDFFNLTYMCQTEGATRGEKVFPGLVLAKHFRAIPPKWRYISNILGLDFGTTLAHQSALVLTGRTPHNLIIVRAGWKSPTGSSDELVDKMAEWKNDPALGWHRVYVDPSQSSLVDRFRGEFGVAAFKGHRYVDTRIGALLTLIDRGAILFDMNGPGVEMVWNQVTSYRYNDAGQVIELADDLVDALLYSAYEQERGVEVGYAKPAEIIDSGKVKSYRAGVEFDRFDPTTETGIGQAKDGFKGWGSMPGV